MPTFTKGDHEVNYTVSKVTIANDSTVTGYGGNQTHKNDVVNGVKVLAHWTAEFDIDEARHKVNRVRSIGYPNVDRHPSHVHEKGWKYNIEEGKGTVDRYVLYDCVATIKSQKSSEVDTGKKVTKRVDNKNVKVPIMKHVITTTIEITGKGKILVDTH
jgi:hypothetical protein